MLKLDSIKVNTELEQAGQYVEIPKWKRVENGETKVVKLGVRSLEIPAYKIAFENAVEKLSRKYKGNTVPPEERESIVGALLAEHILFGWQGIAPEYTPEVARDFLSVPAGRELSKMVI